ncbi:MULTISPECIES: NFACT family protein [Fusobacterium]|jgi:predicted ribosome quality control (RQC) complex YloA/Tae2 family protein|uniref:Rqc2 homolog RqcH n=1 Tax=Fusobacterium hominis TaxID=2764326 RepID=A0A7G9GYU2_9FUSO|nr:MULTISPECIES: NFACT family protein [Fusobacterium]QNM15974.1 NFACT family protein [Fusobacterium hominis]
MFYIDGVSLSKIKDELKDELTGKKINKITKNTENSLSLFFGRTELIFSCNPDFPICYITNSKEGVLENNSGLVANMKKHLLNAVTTDIEQLGYDRILIFKFSKINELGEVKNYKIYFEIMGKYSNFIFTDGDNKIIDVLKRFSLEENRLRAIFPGLMYEQPIIDKKISPLDVTRELFSEYMTNNSFLQNVEGIGKLFVQNIKTYKEYENILKDQIKPCIYYKGKRILLATVLNIEPTSSYTNVVNFNNFRELVNYYIENENLSASFDTLKNILDAGIQKKIKKNEKIIKVLEKEKVEKSDYSKYQQYGDIVAASMYSIKKGMSFLVTYDFYNDCMVKIQLDPQLTPQQNLENIYKKYNKLKRGMEANSRRYLEISEELEYLNGIKHFIDNSEDLENLKGIYEELLSQGYLTKKRDKKQKSKKKVKEIGYGIIEKDNYTILYGRNNIENDNLTFKIADKNDLWLHSKNIPGSHVVIKASEITDDIIKEGALVAALYSKANVGDKVSVDYTLKRYINKPKGAKPGFVTYVNEKNITVIKSEDI